MIKRKYWLEFCNIIGHHYWEDDPSNTVFIDLILDTTGKLRDVGIEWMKERIVP